MQLDSKIYVAGHRGLVGSALMRRLREDGFHNLVVRTHAELDLTDQRAVREFFAAEMPEYVFLAAAKVGGILANNTYPADFIYQNLVIQTNVIDSAYRNGVTRMLFLGSSCIYPRDCPQPIKEEYLLTGLLEKTNRPYAIAKIAGIEMCWAYNRQHGTRFVAAMPTNAYGQGDNYDLRNTHVLPALMRRIHEAKVKGLTEVEIWGTGKPRREFLHSDDLADACVHIMTLSENRYQLIISEGVPPLVNVGTGSDVTIRELAELIAQTVGYKGSLAFNTGMPDGTPRKVLDVTLLGRLGWKAKTSLEDGIRRTYADFLTTVHATAAGS